MSKFDAWDRGALSVIFLLCALMVWRHDIFPIFQDIYYHLAMARSFDQAGGVATVDFLHYAPLGRPNLYPPLYHLIVLLPLKAGVAAATVGTWASAATYPLVLLTMWWVCREWISSRASFFSVLVFSFSWDVFYGTGYLSASMLALTLMAWAYHFAVRSRYVAVACCTALALYCHLTLPHLLVVPLLVAAAANPRERRRLLGAVLLAYGLYAPWALHIVKSLGSIKLFDLAPNYSIDLVLCVCATIGAIVLWPQLKKRDIRAVILIVAPLALLPTYSNYAFRFWFHASFFLAILAGVGLASLFSYKGSSRVPRIVPTVVVSALLLVAMFQTVVVRTTYDNDMASVHRTVEAVPSTYLSLADLNSIQYSSLNQYAANTDIQAIIHGVRSRMGPRDILLVPAGSGFEASFITAMTGLATTNGMFKEVLPSDIGASVMPTVHAYLADGYVSSAPKGAEVVPTQLFSLVVLDNADTATQSSVPSAAVPWWIALCLAGLVVLATLTDATCKWGTINKYIRKTCKTDT